MIVDDETEFLDMVKMRLEANGYEVITAFTGEEALQKFNKENPSAIILDVMMPGLNGLQVLEKIREKNKFIPVFITTAYTSEERMKVANKLNATAFILKTESIKDQLANIAEAIKLAEKYKE